MTRWWLLALVPPAAFGWLALASLLFQEAMRAFGTTLPYSPTLWLDALPHRAQHWKVMVGLVASGAVPSLPVAILAAGGIAKLARRSKSPKLKRDPATALIRGTSDNHGHADWLSMARAREMFPGGHPEWGGIVVGEAYRVDQDVTAKGPFKPDDRATWGRGGAAPLLIDPCTTGPTHSLLFAGSGGGKTSSLISTMLHWTGPAVVVDPSSEIGPIVRAAREAMGHKVVEIAPGGAGFNVLAGIDPRSPYATRRVLSVTASICGEEPDRARDAIFSDAGRNLVACLLAHMLWDEALAAEDKALDTFLQAVTTPEKQMKRLLSGIARDTRSSLARYLARTLMGLAEETFSGAYFNATTFVSWLYDDAVASFLSGGEFEPRNLLSEQLTVFLQVPLPTLYASPAVVRVVLDAIAWTAIEADGAYARRILLSVDEAKRIGKVGSIDLVFATGRKYGLTLQMSWLSEAEIAEVYGKDALDAWFENVSWRSYGAIKGRRTAEGVSKDAGEFAVLATSEGGSAGTSGKPMEIGSRSKGDTSNVHEIKRSLIKPDELMKARADELFVVSGGHMIRCGRALYFRRPEMMEQVGGNRFVRQAAE